MALKVGREKLRGGYAQLMTANKPETALYRAPTFSLLLVSHGGTSSCVGRILYVHVCSLDCFIE